jgi:hypothetical protein
VLSLCSVSAGKATGENTLLLKLQGSAVVNKSAASNTFPNPFRSIGNFFKRVFGKKKVSRGTSHGPLIQAVTLSKTEVTATCSIPEVPNKIFCPGNEQLIEVTVSAGLDDNLVYSYKVSGGKITGQGAKVAWDLSGVKPGTYTITAFVDYGSYYGIATRSSIATVKECPDCKTENE